jgi:hypothetical protein
MAFRASIISPITWSLLIPTLGSAVVAFLCLPACFIWNADVFMSLILLVDCLWFILMWIYFLTLQVTLEAGRLTKSSWLRSTVVVLDEKTLIRHRAEHIVLQGVNLSSTFAGLLSQESTTHMQITIRQGNRQVKVGSALKGISKLREELISFETSTILPAALKRLQADEKVVLQPFEFQRGRVTCKGRQADIPLTDTAELKAGVLHFQLGGKRMRVPLKKIWNPLTCLRILTQGTV